MSSDSKTTSFDLEPNPFERSFATKDDKPTPSTKSEEPKNEDKNKHNLHIPNLSSLTNLPQKLPGATPPLLTPGGRRLPPISYSPENITTPGGTLWNSLLTATNPDQPNHQRTSSNNPPHHHLPNMLHSQPGHSHSQSADYSQFLNGSRKSGLTPNESSLRSGLTPGALNAHNNGGSFPFTNQLMTLTPGILNSPMTPGLSSLLGLTHNPTISTPQLQQQLQNQPPHVQQQVQQQVQQLQAQQQHHIQQQEQQHHIQQQEQKQSQQTAQVSTQAGTGSGPGSTKESAKVKQEPGNRKFSGGEESKKKTKKTRKAKTQEPIEEPESPDSKTPQSPMDDDDRKPTTEVEKRQHFLERNRLAASKCRQRKKQKVAKMEDELKFFSTGYLRLTGQVNQLTSQLLQVRDILSNHKTCPLLNQQVGGYDQLNNLIQQINYTTSIDKPANDMHLMTGAGSSDSSMNYHQSVSNEYMNAGTNMPPALQVTDTHGTNSGATSAATVANGYDTIPGSTNISAHPSATDLRGAAADIHQPQASDIRTIQSMSNLASMNNTLAMNPNVANTNAYNLQPVNSMVDLHSHNNNNSLVDLHN